MERQVTDSRYGHVLTNTGVWSPDGKWIVYDVRSDVAGSVFDGDRIERVKMESGEVQVLYRAVNGAKCGVATYSPVAERVVFILGPERPTPQWDYGPSRRQGVIVDTAKPGVAINLDARDLSPPFTPGALRGGTHVHVFSPDGQWVSFTYNDFVLAGTHCEQRNVGVAFPQPVSVSRAHPRSHGGEYFSVLVTRTTANPRPGSDEIRRAFEDAWVGTDRLGIAFQGEVITSDGRAISELYVAELPRDLGVAGDGPLGGTEAQLPAPPRGVVQRRVTRTAGRRYPGLSGPRHWALSSPDGARIGMLMKDDAGVVQFWTVSPAGVAEPVQVSRDPWDVASAFSWSPDGRSVAYAADGSVFVLDVNTRVSRRVTAKASAGDGPRPEACVFSPDGARVAYVRTVDGFNQIFVADVAR